MTLQILPWLRTRPRADSSTSQWAMPRILPESRQKRQEVAAAWSVRLKPDVRE